ncbi:MAG TPA: hypothetical protein VEG64_03975 [Candidatus Sulfotelmatobacter sp.]|nr:hypothetical protein [Candidatus Sulfotelmatobacter sp.]
MSHRATTIGLAVLVVLALAVPAMARHDAANDAKQVSTRMDLLSPATLSGKALQPASYTVSADESKVTISLNGKIVAEAPVQWKDEAGKARYSAFVTDNNQIREIHFSGKTRYIEVAQ